jgi:hypothetical protein
MTFNDLSYPGFFFTRGSNIYLYAEISPSICQRIPAYMSDIFHTLAYASTIFNSVTGP